MIFEEEDLRRMWKKVLKARKCDVTWAFDMYHQNPATYINKYWKPINNWLQEMDEIYGEQNTDA